MPLLQDVNKSLMSPERMCEILAQNTLQINLYSLLKGSSDAHFPQVDTII